jgi:hypothetical protein
MSEWRVIARQMTVRLKQSIKNFAAFFLNVMPKQSRELSTFNYWIACLSGRQASALH